MKVIVIYKSKTGYTKRCARWIAEELGADLFELSQVQASNLKEYTTVIFGGGLYAVGINGINFIKQNLELLQGKKVAVFATGATPYREETTKEIRDSNFTPEQQKQIQFFYMRGGFDYSRLNFIDKILMQLLKLKLKTKKNLTADERGMLAAYSKPVDFTRKQNIDQLITYIEN